MLAFVMLAGGAPAVTGQGLSPNQGMNQTQGPFSTSPQQQRFPEPTPPKSGRSSQKQKQAMLDYNFKKLKKHAQDLAQLASSLQKEIEHSNENVLSLEIVKKAAQAEKLAKKIKNEAKGF